MLNWIQGNPLGREFKALVTHDGAFVMDNMIATEELWFPQREVSIAFPCPPPPFPRMTILIAN